jgi:NhaA family Na+:H+ antiporter
MRTLQNTYLKFIRLESSSSMLLFGSAVLAIIIANTGLKDTYFSFLDTKLSIGFGSFYLSKALILWINDGLMAIFFFVIGLEIKRELLAGELKSLKQSSLPIIAAIGGMIIPISIYFTLNSTEQGMIGWGIPMSTDIAFSLGILNLLGKRVPLSLKIFLTAIAIIDDLGAVIIIAIFYSTHIYWNYILISLGMYAVLIALNYLRIEVRYFMLFCGIIIWYLFLKAGVHPTIAGVLVAFVIPVNRKMGRRKFADEMKSVVGTFENSERPGIFLNQAQLEAIDQAEDMVKKIQPPLQHLEKKLHNWVAYFIMPVFALANAGVELNSAGSETASVNYISWNIGLALFIGKVIGISGFTVLGVRLGLAQLPDSVKIKHIIGISFLCAIGFTMALFINTLAFSDPAFVNAAKMGIILSSVLAGTTGYFYLRYTLKN